MLRANAHSTDLGPPDGDRNGMRSRKINHDDDETTPEFLTNGAVFTKWEEEPLSLQDCTVFVDSKGFFFCYTSDLEKETVCIDLSQVSDVRICVPKEKVRDMWESVSQEPLNERSFAIVFGSNMVDINFLRLVSPTTQTAKEWIDALNTLIKMKKFKNPSVALLLEKQYVKSRCMKNANGKIPIKNICKCLTNSIRYEQRFYDGMQTLQLPHEKNDEIDPDEFTLHHFYKLYTFLCPRQDLDELFMKKCGGRAPFMKLQQVVDFINGEQRDPRLNEILFPYCSREKASDLITKYEPSPELSQTDRMSFDGLARFLMSEDNLILKRDHLSIKHDLNQPITHYFIHSSHNTYLIGRQFGGKSSVEMYRQCLLAGCRCIELDCWDGLGDEPIITHGKALCTNILFKDVIVAIKESAFVTSPLPVILSFENHCSRLQQRKLAEYCIEIFGDMLLHQPLDSHPLEEGTLLPPPNQLLYKILIKNKKLNPELENDLLMSESFDNLCERQLQPIDDNGLEQTNESDNQPTGTTENNTGHLLLRPMLAPKRLSVITEGAMGMDNHQEEVVEVDTEERVGIDSVKTTVVAEDTIEEDAAAADTLVEEEANEDSDNQEAASVCTLTQEEENVDFGNQKAASVDTPGKKAAFVDILRQEEDIVDSGNQKTASLDAVLTKASTLDTLVTGMATTNPINENRASTKTPDQISTTEKVVSVDAVDKKSGTENTVDRKAATVDTISKDIDAVDIVNKKAATVDLEEGKMSTFISFERETNAKDSKMNGATVVDKEERLLSAEVIQKDVPNTVNVSVIGPGAEARTVEKTPVVEKLLQETAAVGRHQEQIASIDILDNLVFGLREERAKESISDANSLRLKLDSSSSNYDDEVAEATKLDANREEDGARCRTSCCSDSSATKDYLKDSDAVSIKTNASNSEEVFEKDSSRIRSNSGGDSKTVIISSGKSKPIYEVSVCRSDSLSKMKNSSSSMYDSQDIDDDIVSSPDRSRTESVQSEVSEASIDEETKSLTSNDNITTKQYKIPSPLMFNGSVSKKFIDSLRRVKSPVNKQYSWNEKSTKLTVRGKSLSADPQESKRQRVLRSASPEEFVDSDEEVRRSNHPRSSSVASTTTLGSATIKFGKKSYRGGSFTSDEDEMGSQQLSTHKNVDPLLSSLVNYVQPSVFQSFEFAEEQNVSHKMSSFNESSAIQLVKTGPVEFTKYNKRQFSRIYPKGTRVDSTNYNPQAFWNVGCQLVSLNLQTPDVPFQLNQAKFEANSQLGYLLKPEIMRRSVDKAFDPFTESPLDGIIPATVVVKVISGQFLTEKKCHTYVMVELYGLPADTKRKNKTKLAHSNFMNTLFSDECFVFTKVILPELALMRFAVYDESDKVLGQIVLPLEGIQPGYRHIPLRTEAGLQCLLSTLFVHISLKTYVPEKYADFADRLFEPMKYQTQIEKRSEQIRVFDITDADEESDAQLPPSLANGPRPSVSSLFSINSSVHIASTSSPLAIRKFMPGESGLDSIMKVEEYVKKEEPVTFEDFKHDKQYLKLLKKHQKDLEVLEKKHEKERANMQKTKQTQREKIKSAFDKSKMTEEKMLEKISKRSNSDVSNELLSKFEQKIKYLEKHMHEKLVENASKMNQEEAEMTAKHIHERVGLRLYHVAEQFENLKSLLYQSQSHEEKLLKEKFEREMTELTKKQAKQSIDDAKSLSADKSIKSKEERERLQRERDRQNMEIFISGRQELKVEQDKEMQALRQKHKEDIERMETEQNRIMESEKNIFRKVTVAKQQILQSGLIASTS